MTRIADDCLSGHWRVLLLVGNNKSLIKLKTIKEKYFPVNADADRIVVGIPVPLSVKYPTTFN